MQKRIGLAGGIGSGKTTVAKLLMALGYSVYFADTEAKDLMNNNSKLRDQIISLLGESAYDDNGLNKPYVAKLVFNDENLLSQLNAIVHPAVSHHFNEWCKDKGELVFQEAAILFENGSYKKFDKNILVTAPVDVRIARVKKRDKQTDEQVLARISNQWSDEKKVTLASYVVVCDGETLVIPQVLKILNSI